MNLMYNRLKWSVYMVFFFDMGMMQINGGTQSKVKRAFLLFLVTLFFIFILYCLIFLIIWGKCLNELRVFFIIWNNFDSRILFKKSFYISYMIGLLCEKYFFVLKIMVQIEIRNNLSCGIFYSFEKHLFMVVLMLDLHS